MRYQAVPSFAIAQFLVEVGEGIVAKRFVALAVFGVLVTFLNVTTFAVLIAHAPVNVATRNGLSFPPATTARERSPPPAGRAFSTARTTRAIRSTAGRVKEMRLGMRYSGSPIASICRRLSAAAATIA